MLWWKKVFLGIFVDLLKAFDTVDHEILITKLEKYGIRGKNLLWVKGYLLNRKQHIEHRDYFSEKKSTNLLQLKCLIPQRFFLSIFFF